MQHGQCPDKRTDVHGTAARTVTVMTYTSDPSITPATAPALAAGRPSALARGAFVAAIVLVALSCIRQLALTLVTYFAREMNYTVFSAIQNVLTALFTLGAIAILVIAIVSLASRREPKWAAGVAVGAAGTVLAFTLAGLLSTLLFQIFR